LIVAAADEVPKFDIARSCNLDVAATAGNFLSLLTMDEDEFYTEHKVERKNRRLRMKSTILCLLALSLLPSMSQARDPVFQTDHAASTVKFSVSASVP
jgi:hypothetical protein